MEQKEEMFEFDIEVEKRKNRETNEEFYSYRGYSSKLKTWFGFTFPKDFPEDRKPKENGKLTVKQENIFRDKRMRFLTFRIKDYEKFEPIVFKDEDLSKYF